MYAKAMLKLKIGPRLIVSFLIVAAFSLVLGVVGIISSTIMSDEVSLMYDEPVTAINSISVIRGRFNNIRLHALELAVGGDDAAEVSEQTGVVNGYKEDIEEAVATYEATITDMSKEIAFKDFQKLFPAYMKRFDQVVEAANSGGAEAALAAFYEYDVEADAVLTAIEDMAEYNVEIAQTLDAEADDIALTVLLIQIAVIVVAVIAAIGIAIAIAKGIDEPVNYVTDILRAIGTRGRTTFTEEEWAEQRKLAAGHDETAECATYLGNVANALNSVAHLLEKVADGDLSMHHTAMSEDDNISNAIIKMVDGLNRMFSEIDVAAKQVNVGAHQISEASQQLAEGSTEQAATVEELSASIQDIAE
jgi:methyl-accepting chemotaxis protein